MSHGEHTNTQTFIAFVFPPPPLLFNVAIAISNPPLSLPILHPPPYINSAIHSQPCAPSLSGLTLSVPFIHNYYCSQSHPIRTPQTPPYISLSLSSPPQFTPFSFLHTRQVSRPPCLVQFMVYDPSTLL